MLVWEDTKHKNTVRKKELQLFWMFQQSCNILPLLKNYEPNTWFTIHFYIQLVVRKNYIMFFIMFKYSSSLIIFLMLSYHNSNVMSPVKGQGPVQLQHSMLGPQEAAEVGRVQGHHHGDVVQTTQWQKGFHQDVLVQFFFQHLERESSHMTNDSLTIKFTLYFLIYSRTQARIHLKNVSLLVGRTTTFPLSSVESL